MKKLTCVAFFAVSTIIVFTQNRQSVIEPKNCGTMQYLEQQMKEDPSLAQRLVEYEQGLQKWVMEHKDNLNPSRAV
ncbi:MAG: hypothetical protein V1781_01880, partial [Bacteroidota bacterium]